jgi:hypothetical protein
MHIFILKKSSNFQAVVYNLDKVDKNHAELITAKNFGALDTLACPRARDYQNYFEAQTARNSRVQFAQFHAVLSVKGHLHSATELGIIAEQWLVKMGYGKQPYLLFLHKDTANDHVHIVSTRIDQKGRKLSQAFEQIRAWAILNEITGLNPEEVAKRQLAAALTFTFSNEEQFLALLKAKGYAIYRREHEFQFFRFGKMVLSVARSAVSALMKSQNPRRRTEIQALIETNRRQADPALYPVDHRLVKGWATQVTGYSSDLADLLMEKHRLEVVFRHQYGRPPKGFTLIDHDQRQVFDDDQLLGFDAFIRADPEKFQEGQSVTAAPSTAEDQPMSPDWITSVQIDITDDVDDEQAHGKYRRKRTGR